MAADWRRCDKGIGMLGRAETGGGEGGVIQRLETPHNPPKVPDRLGSRRH